jgi:hypothetical protein
MGRIGAALIAEVNGSTPGMRQGSPGGFWEPLPKATLKVRVEGVHDPKIVNEITRHLTEVFCRLPGAWTVTLAPSPTRGRWNVIVRGAKDRHVFSFAGNARSAPLLLKHYLGESVA